MSINNVEGQGVEVERGEIKKIFTMRKRLPLVAILYRARNNLLVIEQNRGTWKA